VILTTTRHGRSGKDARALAAHLAKDAGQESRVVAIGNCPVSDSDQALRYMQAMRDGSQATVAFHHITINPAKPLTDDQRDEAVQRVLAAFGAEDHAHVVWEHAEKRRATGDADQHFHVVLGHVGPDGRALDDAHSYRKLEAVARSLEVDFGHDVVHSRRTAAVMDELRSMGREDVAQWLADEGAPDTPPPSATSSRRRAAAAREGIDLPAAQAAVRDAWQASDNPQAFVAALREQGIEIAPGRKAGVFVVSKDGTEIGALDRVVRMKRGELAERMKEVQHVHDADRHQAPRSLGAAAVESAPARPTDGQEGQQARRADLQRGEGRARDLEATPAAPGPAGGPGARGRAAGRDQGLAGGHPSRAQASDDGDRDLGAGGRRAARRPHEARRRVRELAAVRAIGRTDFGSLRKLALDLQRKPEARVEAELAERIEAAAPQPLEPSEAALEARQQWKAENELVKAAERSAKAARERLASLRQNEPRGLFARVSGRRKAWERALDEAEDRHASAKETLNEAYRHRDAARKAETQAKNRDKAQHDAAERERRRQREVLEEARRILRERPELAAGRDGMERILRAAESRLRGREAAERMAQAVDRPSPFAPRR
jgi:hypothetical protein